MIAPAAGKWSRGGSCARHIGTELYTFAHGLCYGGLAEAVNPTVPEAQHLSLVTPTRWAARRQL